MKRFIRTLAVLLIAAAVGLTVRMFGVTTARVAGTSMSHTLESGDVVLITKAEHLTGKAPERGEIVQCTFPGRTGVYLKRVIGLPGETVEAIADLLYIDGRPYPELYCSSGMEDFSVTVPDDSYLVLGDNRAESYDSRAEDMGCVRGSDLLGTVRFILWPLDRIGPTE